MIRWLLDTDHISLNERGHPAVQARLASIPPDAGAVSVITMEEMIRGRLAVLARQSKGETRIIAYRNFMETVLFFGGRTSCCEQTGHRQTYGYGP